MKMRGTDKDLISKAELGRRVGLSRARIDRLVADGLPLHDGRIDYPEAAAWIADHVDPIRQEAAKGTASLNELRREREAVKVETSRLELARIRGELIDKKLVKRFISERVGMERAAWLSWASAAAGRLATALNVDHGHLFSLLEGEVRKQLQFLADKKLGQSQ